MRAQAISSSPNIYYDIVPSSFGYVLIAATEKGVCSIRLHQHKETLTAARPTGSTANRQALGPYSQAIAQFVQGTARELSFPIDVDGTELQQEVWETLRTIPYGEVLTYQALAERAGYPRAVRAVANACGANPLGLYYPCHRVIRSDGGLGGFSFGGTEVKKALLAMERGK